MADLCLAVRESTYRWDPMRPDSSAPQKAKRTALRSWRSDIASAVSRMAAVPDPLSLMPGPSSTESRWAPTIRVRSVRPVEESAITLVVVRCSTCTSATTRTSSVPCAARPASSLPTSKEASSTGIESWGGSSVPKMTSVRPSWPSLKMMTALAPAATALSAFCRKVQVPRWMRAMLPAVNPSKSDASQPLVELGAAVGRVRSTGVTSAVTSPSPEYSMT